MNLNKNLWPVFTIILFAGLAHFPGLGNDFTCDDVALFVKNDFYQKIENSPKILGADLMDRYKDVDPALSQARGSFSGFVAYRPITAISFFVDSFLWGVNPWGFHWTNWVLHIFCCFLLYVLGSIVLRKDNLALLSALLFAVHPIQVELMNTAGYRSDLFVTFFYLLAFILFIKLRSENNWMWGRLSLVSFMMALLSKESAVTLPFVLLVYELFFPKPNTIRWHAAFFVTLAGYLLAYFVVFPNTSLGGEVGFNFAQQISLAIKALGHYGAVLLWPFQVTVLPPLYWPDFNSLALPEILFVSLLLISAIGFSAYFFHRERMISFFMVWVILTYVPVANLFPLPNPMAYRFLYLPSVGFFVVISYFLLKIKRSFLVKEVLVSLLIVLSMILSGFFKNNIILCERMTQEFPNARRPYWILGLTYLENQQYQRAISYFKEYLKLPERNPFVRFMNQDYFIHHQLGRCYVGDPNQAIVEFQEAIRLRPDYALAYADLAKAYLFKADYQRSLDAALKAISLQDDLIIAYVYAIHNLWEQGNLKKAQELMKRAKDLAPLDPNLLYLKNKIENKI